jgi:hypothetical protein
MSAFKPCKRFASWRGSRVVVVAAGVVEDVDDVDVDEVDVDVGAVVVVVGGAAVVGGAVVTGLVTAVDATFELVVVVPPGSANAPPVEPTVTDQAHNRATTPTNVLARDAILTGSGRYSTSDWSTARPRK